MTLKQLNKETIALIGFGSEHYAMLDYLFSKHITAPITVFEMKSRRIIEKRYPKLKQWKQIDWQKDTRDLETLKLFSLIIKSPGAFFSPELRRALSREFTTIISPMELFLEYAPSKQTIGVTGTKGKGTTSSLIAHILEKAGKRVWLGGNIGVAPFSFISKIKKTDWIILELSSFQLEDMRVSPRIAVLTNFSAEHLEAADPNNPNHHPSLSHYWQSKLRIAKQQSKQHVLIANIKLKSKIKKEKLASKLVFFSSSKLNSMLPGEHNKENIAASECVAKQLKIKDNLIKGAIKSFRGLEYRLELIGMKKGVNYYNDSFATVPDATITALQSFNQPIVLLAGGADKGSDFSQLAKLINKKVSYLVLFKGKGSDRLKLALKKIGFPKQKTAVVGSMKKAMNIARQIAQVGDIILLSPACASFGVFKNYKDRGAQFKQEFLRR